MNGQGSKSSDGVQRVNWPATLAAPTAPVPPVCGAQSRVIDAHGQHVAIDRHHPPADLAIIEVDRVAYMSMVEHLRQRATDARNRVAIGDGGR
ncbi:hypothetical protein AWC32_23525 [Mycobacterium xenopi]|nr:hypothetical protein AWC32_23525 [Mycobacterium xenopi]